MANLTPRVRDMIDELWGLGYSVVRRPPMEELMDLPRPPAGMAYQWFDKPEADGWKPVPCARHPGYFAPLGSSDDIAMHHLFLLERPKAEVDAFHKASHAKAQKNVDNWFAGQGAAGFTGEVKILGEGSDGQSAEVVQVGGGDGLRTKIPPDLFPHLSELLAERDRLVAASIKASMDTLAGGNPDEASLRASCLNLAMAAIRKKHHLAPRIDERTKTIEDESSIPDDLLDRAGAIFTERDLLWTLASHWWGKDGTPQYQRYQQLAAANPEWTRGQIMNAVLLPIAIENTRQRLEGASNG